jgi:hypothetical protein
MSEEDTETLQFSRLPDDVSGNSVFLVNAARARHSHDANESSRHRGFSCVLRLVTDKDRPVVVLRRGEGKTQQSRASKGV